MREPRSTARRPPRAGVAVACLCAAAFALGQGSSRFDAAFAAMLASPDGRALLEAFMSLPADAIRSGVAYRGALRGLVDAVADPYLTIRPSDDRAPWLDPAHPSPVLLSTLGDVAVLHVATFDAADTGDLLVREVERLATLPVRALVLDLRGNPGGLVRGGLQALDVFLADVVLGYRQSRTGASPLAYANPRANPIPLAVLIDPDTASTAEIVAGTLQTYGRARLYGQVTAGKSLGQSTFPLQDGTELRIPDFRWLLPDGRDIGGFGLTPDVPMPFTPAMRPLDLTSALNDPTLDPTLVRAVIDLRRAVGDELPPAVPLRP